MTSYAMLSTHPPTQCGLATFSAALAEHLSTFGDEIHVVPVLDDAPDAPDVRSASSAALIRDDPQSAVAAAARLNDADVVVVQHEFGIYGGRDGEQVLQVLDRVEAPLAVVLHTVLSAPSKHQQWVLERIADRADRLIVMSQTAKRRLTATTAIGHADVVVIPHGADVVTQPLVAPPVPTRPPTILTWGLIGPGKGIEWAVDAIAELRKSGLDARYRIVGQTHPRVAERHGESYRRSLMRRARLQGVDDLVEFDATFHDKVTLQGIVRQADAVLLPYDNSEQVTSGVLIEAVAAHKPVVATMFPHAVELLSGGAGLLVPRRDPVAMAAALRQILLRRDVAARMSACSAQISPTLAWPAVAAAYRAVADDLVDDRMRIAA